MLLGVLYNIIRSDVTTNPAERREGKEHTMRLAEKVEHSLIDFAKSLQGPPKLWEKNMS